MPRLGSLYVRHGDIDIEIATVARADDTDLHNADFVVRCGDGDWPGLRADLLFPTSSCSPVRPRWPSACAALKTCWAKPCSSP